MINKELAKKKKKDLFFYFVLILKGYYEGLEKYHKLQFADLNVYRILAMLYIATIRDNRMLDIGFNKFVAFPK